MHFDPTALLESLDLTALLEYPNQEDRNQFQKGVSVETLKLPKSVTASTDDHCT